ncbi:hypothetical protein [Streptomyces sp. TRM64462]|nr:hypothetical protein [Streptomyces sp. TRM64462]
MAGTARPVVIVLSASPGIEKPGAVDTSFLAPPRGAGPVLLRTVPEQFG